MDYVKAFVVGGIICAIVQILMEKTKLMPGRIMAVSYTHLDVYKRQGICKGAGETNFEVQTGGCVCGRKRI